MKGSETPSAVAKQKGFNPSTPRRPKVEQYSAFNMAGWEINNINTIEQSAHEFYLESEAEPYYLYRSLEALYRAYIIFRSIIGSRKTRDRLDKKFKDLLIKTRARKLRPANEDYYTLRDEVSDLTIKYFEEKQRVGLNFPIEKTKDSEAMIEDYTSQG